MTIPTDVHLVRVVPLGSPAKTASLVETDLQANQAATVRPLPTRLIQDPEVAVSAQLDHQAHLGHQDHQVELDPRAPQDPLDKGTVVEDVLDLRGPLASLVPLVVLGSLGHPVPPVVMEQPVVVHLDAKDPLDRKDLPGPVDHRDLMPDLHWVDVPDPLAQLAPRDLQDCLVGRAHVVPLVPLATTPSTALAHRAVWF